MKTEFTFWSTAFNCSKPQPYYINECCYGDDVCRWIIAMLVEAGITVDAEPTQEDFGWFLNFKICDEPHTLIIAFQPNSEIDGDCWRGWIEKKHGIWKSLFRKRNIGVHLDSVKAIEGILNSNPQLSQIEWHEHT